MPETGPDEYDVIMLYPSTEVPFIMEETEDGEAAFAGYKGDLPCSTIQNIGDVIVAIDGASTEGSTLEEIRQFIEGKARQNAYSFFRFRSVSNADGVEGNLPFQKQRTSIEQEILILEVQKQQKLRELEGINEALEAKRKDLKTLRQKDLEWINKKWGELDYEI